MERIYQQTLIISCLMGTLLTSCSLVPERPTSRFHLENGMVLLVAEDHSSPFVCFDLFVRGGSRMEETAGTAHLLEHLIFRGNQNKVRQHTHQIQKFGGQSAGSTWYDYTHYTHLVPVASFESSLKSLKKSIQELNLKESFLKKEKPVLLAELQGRADRLETRLTDQILKATLKDSIYQKEAPGTLTSIRELKLAKVKNFYQKYYYPANLILVVTGDVKTERVAQQIKNIFPVSLSNHQKKIKLAPPVKKQIGFQLHQKKATRFSLGAGIKLPPFSHPDRFPLLVAERYLAGFLREYLMEDFQFKTTVEINSYYLQATGVMAITLIGGDPQWVATEFIQGLTKIRNQKRLSKAIVEDIKHLLLLQYFKESEDIQQVALKLGESETLGDYRYYSKFPELLKKVTVFDVLRVLNQYLSSDNLTITISSPKKVTISLSQNWIGTPPNPNEKVFSPRKSNTTTSSSPLIPETLLSTQLDNGLQLILRQRPQAPVVSLGLFFQAGESYETKERAGVASLLQSYFEERIYRNPNEPLRIKLARLGGDFYFKMSPELFWGEITVLPKDTLSALRVIKEAMREPSPAEKIILPQVKATQKIKWKQSLRMLPSVAKQKLSQLVFSEHPYGKNLSETPEVLDSLSLEDLQQYYDTSFAPNRGALVIVGNFDPVQVEKKVKKIFSSWNSKNPQPIKRENPSQIRQRTYREKTNFQQTALGFAVKTCAFGEADHLPLLVLQNVIADRIFQRLVHEKSLAYQTLALGDFYQQSGILGSVVLISPENEKLAKFELLDIIATLRKEKISSNELQKIKKRLQLNQLLYYRSSIHLVHGLGFLNLLSQKPLPELEEALKEVDREKVLQLAKKYLAPKKIVQLVLKGNPKNQ